MNLRQPSAAPLMMPSGAAANNYSDLYGLAALKAQPNSPQAAKAVGQQIDAMFLQMMLKSMRDAAADIGEQPSNAMGMYQDMFDKQIALTMSQHQDLGLGSMLTRQLPGAAPPLAGGAPPAAAAEAAAPQSTALTEDAAQFVAEVLPAINRAAAALGVSPAAMLAQAALETGWGKRMARTANGAPSLNLFGIKAGDSWSGARAAATTVEFDGGVATRRRSAFRAYGSIEQSVGDFANLLHSSPRYAQTIAAGRNAQDYIASIGRSGYATDPDYANKLNEILGSATMRAALKTNGVVL